ncbi:MAG: hypothetical protein EZS28_024298 [Streblomastix strix]|uniref:Uncharacterized protein n=1 Tax=Streblomastix strix TaxID=222440 RepID=A0A5J4VCB2_9EUKA|nr:MAG: hypothetical protein EZS28_024298 [Streblomastix strix]
MEGSYSTRRTLDIVIGITNQETISKRGYFPHRFQRKLQYQNESRSKELKLFRKSASYMSYCSGAQGKATSPDSKEDILIPDGVFEMYSTGLSNNMSLTGIADAGERSFPMKTTVKHVNRTPKRSIVLIMDE